MIGCFKYRKMVASVEAPAKIKASYRIILSKMLIVDAVHSMFLFIKKILISGRTFNLSRKDLLHTRSLYTQCCTLNIYKTLS